MDRNMKDEGGAGKKKGSNEEKGKKGMKGEKEGRWNGEVE